MIKSRTRNIAIAVAFAATAVTAVAGPPWIAIESPVNPHDPLTRNGFLVVRTYHHGDLTGFEIAGTAEGSVGGKRRSAPLDIRALKASGSYVVNWKKPAGGNWVLLISTRRDGQHMATAVVRIDQSGRVAGVAVPTRTIENGRWHVPNSVSPAEVNAMLR